MTTTTTTPLAVDVVSTRGGLLAIEAEWRALWSRVDTASPFHSPDWLVPWWESYGEGKELAVVVVRREARLVGILPMCILTDRGPRELVFVGTGNTDHLDLLTEPLGASEVASASLHAIAHLRGRWDAVDLQELAPSSPLLSARVPREVDVETSPDATCPMIELTGGASFAPVSPSFRKRLAYARRRAAALGARWVVAAGARSRATLIEALFDLHGARWGAKGESGVLQDPATRAFHREVVERFGRLGALRMFAIEVGERLAGVYYGFARNEVSTYYLSGFDPAFERVSVGSLLVAEAIDAAIREKYRWFDFLRGREPYKYRWGAVDHRSFRLRMRARDGRMSNAI